MTSTITKTTETFLRSHTYAAASTTVGIIVILLLTALLIEKELLRAYGGLRTNQGVALLNTVIAPLVLTLVVVVIQRVMGMLAG